MSFEMSQWVSSLSQPKLITPELLTQAHKMVSFLKGE